MSRTRPCYMCGKETSKSLFGDRSTGVAICSWNCEGKYLGTLSQKEEERIVHYLDMKIQMNKRNDRISWTIAIGGLIVVAAGFFVKNAELFIVGVLPMTLGAFSTRHFEHRTSRLTKQRMRVRI